MKTLSTLLLCTVLALSANAHFFKKPYTKEWNHSFEVESDVTLEVDNKYGAVHINTWDQNEIKVDVTVQVDKASEDKAMKLLEQISINHKQSKGRVILETEFKDMGKIKNSDLRIDYTISMPKSGSLDMENQFGGVFIASIDGNVKLRLDYGSLDAERLNSNKNEITLSFSTGQFDFLGGGVIQVRHGAASIEESKELDLMTAHSSISIDNITMLNASSAYDQYAIDNAETLHLDGKFTSFEVDDLEFLIKANLEYGAMNIDHVAKEFKDVEVKSKAGGSINVDIEDGASYVFHAIAEIGAISLPKGAMIDNKVEKMLYKDIVGHVGKSPGEQKVTIETSQGSINIE